MRKTVIAVILALIMLLPCFAHADEHEIIIEDFDSTDKKAEELFQPEDLSSWSILPPDLIDYSEDGAQDGKGLRVVFGESASTQTYCIYESWVAEKFAPALSEYNYIKFWFDNQTTGDIRLTIVLAENLDPDPAIRKAAYLPVEDVIGIWEEDGYEDDFETGPSLCDPDNNPDASVYVPAEFKGWIYWAVPDSVDQLITQEAWNVGNISSFDAVAAMQIDVRATYSPDGCSYLFDSIGFGEKQSEGDNPTPSDPQTTPSAQPTQSAQQTQTAQSSPAPQPSENSNTLTYIIIAAAVIVAAGVVAAIIISVRKKKANK